MNAIRISDVYENGVEEFLKFAEWHGTALIEKYFYPCVNCLNGRRQEVKLIREHLLCDGILKSYTTWIWHGEVVHLPTLSQYKVKDDDDDEDNMKKGPHAKVLWYLPIIPRFKCLFANVDDAKNVM